MLGFDSPLHTNTPTPTLPISRWVPEATFPSFCNSEIWGLGTITTSTTSPLETRSVSAWEVPHSAFTLCPVARSNCGMISLKTGRNTFGQRHLISAALAALGSAANAIRHERPAASLQAVAYDLLATGASSRSYHPGLDTL